MEKTQLALKTAPGEGEFGNERQVGQVPRAYRIKERTMWQPVEAAEMGAGELGGGLVFLDSLPNPLVTPTRPGRVCR